MAHLSTPGTRCFRHAMIVAQVQCDKCGNPVCSRCALPQPDGLTFCLGCTQPGEVSSSSSLPPLPSPTAPSGPPPLSGHFSTSGPSSFRPSFDAPPAMPGFSPSRIGAQAYTCVNHPEVSAYCACSGCGAHICHVCDFALPMSRHACPACAMKEPEGVSPKRRNLAIGGMVIAGISTIMLGLLMTGMLASMLNTGGMSANELGILLIILIFVPAVIGFALSMTATEKHLPNAGYMWVGVVWNVLLIAGFLTLCIVGLLSR